MRECCALVLQHLMLTILCKPGYCMGTGPKAVRGHRDEEMSRNQVSLRDELFLGKGGTAVSHSSQLRVQWSLTKGLHLFRGQGVKPSHAFWHGLKIVRGRNTCPGWTGCGWGKETTATHIRRDFRVAGSSQ